MHSAQKPPNNRPRTSTTQPASSLKLLTTTQNKWPRMAKPPTQGHVVTVDWQGRGQGRPQGEPRRRWWMLQGSSPPCLPFCSSFSSCSSSPPRRAQTPHPLLPLLLPQHHCWCWHLPSQRPLPLHHRLRQWRPLLRRRGAQQTAPRGTAPCQRTPSRWQTRTWTHTQGRQQSDRKTCADADATQL
jgi:hypothetical protein